MRKTTIWKRTGIKCPQPGKAEFANKQEAKTFIKNKRLGRMTIYHCECGAWHLTSQIAEVSREIHRQIINRQNGNR